MKSTIFLTLLFWSVQAFSFGQVILTTVYPTAASSLFTPNEIIFSSESKPLQAILKPAYGNSVSIQIGEEKFLWTSKKNVQTLFKVNGLDTLTLEGRKWQRHFEDTNTTFVWGGFKRPTVYEKIEGKRVQMATRYSKYSKESFTLTIKSDEKCPNIVLAATIINTLKQAKDSRNTDVILLFLPI